MITKLITREIPREEIPQHKKQWKLTIYGVEFGRWYDSASELDDIRRMIEEDPERFIDDIKILHCHIIDQGIDDEWKG